MIPVGKLRSDLLGRFLAPVDVDQAVVLGPAVGIDAAAIDIGDAEILLASADPITLAGADLSRYALAVNANDIAVMGGTPRWFLATVLLPPGTAEADVAALFLRLHEECARTGVSLVGGHTEVTAAVKNVVISGTMLGTVARDGLLMATACREGDDLWLAGAIAVEGTAILCAEASGELQHKGVPAAVIEAGRRLIEEPGINIAAAAGLAYGAGARAMHDPTEGGIYGALSELASAAERRIVVTAGDIPILEETRIVCAALGLDPRGLLASGSLLIVAGPGRRSELSAAFERSPLPLTQIGVMGGSVAGGIITGDDGAELRTFERDELARYSEASSASDARQGV